MGIADRLATAGNADNSPGIGPKRAARNDSGTKTSRSAFGTGPADTITQESEFHTEKSGRFDVRPDQVLITLTSFAGTDSFTITFKEADGTEVTTAAIVRGTNASAGDVQTAIRNALTGADLTVVTGTTDEGPFTIKFNDDEFYGRVFPKVVAITGTGCTGAATYPADNQVKRYLGETKYEGTTELVGPTIGTITVTAGTDEVQTLALSAGTDGGTFDLEFRRGRGSALAWNATPAEIEAELGNIFEQAGFAASAAPTVGRGGTAEVQTLTLSSWDGGDTIKLTFDGNESAAVTNPQADAAGFQAAIDEVAALSNDAGFEDYEPGDIVVTRTDATHYVFTFSGGDLKGRNVGAISATSGTGSASGSVAETTPGVDTESFIFTFENGALAGMPIRGGLRLGPGSALTDGGVAEDAAFTVTTAGVLGSASAAYTEQATVGDSVFGEAVNDATGKGYSAQKDAASPAVFSGLPVGDYTLVLRTVADKSLSAPSTKAFSVTSA